jgi:hypothetical protein
MFVKFIKEEGVFNLGLGCVRILLLIPFTNMLKHNNLLTKAFEKWGDLVMASFC